MEFEANYLRRKILKMAFEGQSVHVGCAFSIVEILAVLYRSFLNNSDGNISDPNRNLIILSKGHGVMAQYVCLNELGWLDDIHLENYFKDGSQLKGLGECDIPGLEVSSGSLGHGLSVAVGMALGNQIKKEDRKTFCIVGDGESNEGSIWEAFLFSSHFKLSNLVVIIDKNKFQAMGTTDEIMNLGSLSEKFISFGFDTLEVDGHNEEEIFSSLNSLLNKKNDKPKALVAHTIKGQGVSFMENNNTWHYTRLNQETYQSASKELE